MAVKFPKKLRQLDSCQRLKINGTVFTIKKKTTYQDEQEYQPHKFRKVTIITYHLDDDYFLGYEWGRWSFGRCIESTWLWLFSVKTAKYYEIKSLEMLSD